MKKASFFKGLMKMGAVLALVLFGLVGAQAQQQTTALSVNSPLEEKGTLYIGDVTFVNVNQAITIIENELQNLNLAVADDVLQNVNKVRYNYYKVLLIELEGANSVGNTLVATYGEFSGFVNQIHPGIITDNGNAIMSDVIDMLSL